MRVKEIQRREDRVGIVRTNRPYIIARAVDGGRSRLANEVRERAHEGHLSVVRQVGLLLVVVAKDNGPRDGLFVDYWSPFEDGGL